MEEVQDNDPGIASLVNANTPAVCVVGKSWDFHVKIALGIKNEENLENIRETAKHFVKNKKEFLFDAEHFLMDINRPSICIRLPKTGLR